MKKLIPTICLAAVGAAGLVGSTFAWFSMSENVEANGLSVKAETEGGLLVGSTIDTITKTRINFNTTNDSLIQATHDDTLNSGSTDFKYKSQLKSISSDTEVDARTGKIEGTANYVEANANTHYVEKMFYIGAASAEGITGSLKMSLSDLAKEAVATKWASNLGEFTKGKFDTDLAFAVDVYMTGVVTSQDVNDSDKKPNTLYANREEKNYLAYKGTYHIDSITEELTILENEFIPSTKGVAKDGDDKDVEVYQGMCVMFRVYLDGDYAKGSAVMEEASGTYEVGVAYFEKKDGEKGYAYNRIPNPTIGQAVSEDALVVKATKAASNEGDKYVHTERADTTGIDLGFKLSAIKSAS